MRKLLMTVAGIAAMSLGLGPLPPQPASAQQIVFDPKAVTQAIQQVRQGLAQIQQLQTQVTNQMAMLQKLGTDVTQPLAQINAQATQLLQQAQAIGYNSQNSAGQFQQFYPSSLSGQSFAQIQQRLASWEANSRLTLQDSMAVQNQLVQSQGTTAGAVKSAVAASQGAAGQTAAILATNQLLAALSSQLQGLQAILVAQARTQETILAQQQAGAVAARAETERATQWAPQGSSLANASSF
jgi:type IV secretion system protein TrbJ